MVKNWKLRVPGTADDLRFWGEITDLRSQVLTHVINLSQSVQHQTVCLPEVSAGLSTFPILSIHTISQNYFQFSKAARMQQVPKFALEILSRYVYVNTYHVSFLFAWFISLIFFFFFKNSFIFLKKNFFYFTRSLGRFLGKIQYAFGQDGNLIYSPIFQGANVYWCCNISYFSTKRCCFYAVIFLQRFDLIGNVFFLNFIPRVQTLPVVPLIDCFERVKNHVLACLTLFEHSNQPADLQTALAAIEGVTMKYFTKEM